MPFSGGGILTFYRLLLPLLARNGHSIRVVLGSGVFAQELTQAEVIEGVQIEALEVDRFRRHFARFEHLAAMPGLRRHLAGAWALWEQALEGGDADIIEACDWGLLFVPPVIGSSRPVITQMHGSIGQIHAHDPIAGEDSQGLFIQMLETAVLKRSSGVQTLSQANASFWRQQTGRSVDVILPSWAPAAAQAREEAANIGLVVGRVQRWKGPQVLCEALSLLGSQAPGIEWYGRDTDAGEKGKSYSKTLAERYPSIWGPLIQHRPPVPPETVAELQKRARFVMVPSTWDVFNFTCVEAMAAERPVICSNGAGASELIEDGVNGFVFENENAEALASALDRVLSLSKAQAAEIGKAARATVETRLDPQRIANQRLEAYARTIKEFTPSPARQGDWLVEACSASDTNSSELAFLDHLPLRPLLGYAARRFAKKIGRR